LTNIKRIIATVIASAGILGASAFTGTLAMAHSVPACSRAQISPSLYGQAGAAAGSEYYNIRLLNTGGVCTIIDSPNVTFAYADNYIASPYALHVGTPRQVTVKHNWSAHSVLQLANADNYPSNVCAEVNTSKILIVPPQPRGYRQSGLTYRPLETRVCSQALPMIHGGAEAQISPLAPGK
jgi:Protein of unknown function (DUF4232)